MNNTSRHSSDPGPAGKLAAATSGGAQTRRLRGVALLGSTVLLSTAPLAAAVLALAPAPFAASVAVAAHSSTSRPSTTANGDDPCVTAAHSRALGTFKYPLCAGD
jgi:hypothetical protein